MALENLTTWFFPPNWANGIIETLEWLNSPLASVNGAEQRISLRRSPRRFFELSFLRAASERAVFDMLVQRVAGSDFYLPIWHDSHKLTVAEGAGASIINVESTLFSEFQDCPGLFIKGPGLFNFEIVQYLSNTETTITLNGFLAKSWPKGTRVYPLQRAQIETQPNMQRPTNQVFTVSVKFRVDNANPSSATVSLTLFNNQWVLEREPNAIADLSFEYQRILATLDNSTGRSMQQDVNPYAETLQQFSFYAKGKEDHAWLRALFYLLEGRRYPIFVPTFMQDIEPIETVSDEILAKRCGFTDFAGPFRGREYLQFKFRDNSFAYRRATGSALEGEENERIQLDSALGSPVSPFGIKRVSYLSLCRLDQDSLEINHLTDDKGVATATAVFRSLPQVRQPIPDPAGDFKTDADDGTNGEDTRPHLFVFEISILTTEGNDFGDGGYSTCIGVADESFNIECGSPLDVNTDDRPELSGGMFFSSIRSGNAVGWGYPRPDSHGPFCYSGSPMIWMIAIDFKNKTLKAKDVTHDDTVWWGVDHGTDFDTVVGIPFGSTGSLMSGNIHILGGVCRTSPFRPNPTFTYNPTGPFTGTLPPGDWTPPGGTWDESDSSVKIIVDGLTVSATDYTEPNNASYFVRSTFSYEIAP